MSARPERSDLARRVAGATAPITAAAAVLTLLGPLWFTHSQYTTGLAVTALIFAAYGIGFNLIFHDQPAVPVRRRA